MRRQAELPLIVRAQTAALALNEEPVALTLLVPSGREFEASGDARFSKEQRWFGPRRMPAAAQNRPSR
jgi:hypothetical protein